MQGLVVFGIGLGLTRGALAAVHTWFPEPGRLVELGALVVANAAATLARFMVLRRWVFGPAV